jgi:proline iminopeptidase
MILRSILLANNANQEWFFKQGANKIFPDYWRDFVKDIPANEQDDVLHAYHQRLNSKNELMRMSAAKAWSLWHRRCASLQPLGDEEDNNFTTLRLARIESHYFSNGCFIEENQILDNMRCIKNIPAIIIHGRYDMVCPLSNAFQLHKALNHSRLEIIRDAGHASSEPAMTDALIKATNALAKNLKSS